MMTSLKYKNKTLTCSQSDIIEFNEGTVTITDPSYDHDVFNKIEGLSIVPGHYNCSVYSLNGQPYIIRIVLDKPDAKKTVASNHTWHSIGTVATDTGTLGVFQNKPDFSTKRMHRLNFINQRTRAEVWSDNVYKNNPRGFVFGCGDNPPINTYDVKACTKNHRAFALEIRLA